MAIDTRDKRSSAIHVTMPWRGLEPLPDGGLNQGDRQQTAFMYRGILASAPASETVFKFIRRHGQRIRARRAA